MRASLLPIGAALAVSACDQRPETAEWRQVCVESHQEFSHFLMVSTGRGGVVPIAQYRTVCDRHERRCIAGRDGATECHS